MSSDLGTVTSSIAGVGSQGGDKNSAVSDPGAMTSCARFVQTWVCLFGFQPYRGDGSPTMWAESERPTLAPPRQHPPDPIGHLTPSQASLE